MTQTHLDRERYVLGDPSDHVGFLNCERIVERSHIHGWSVEPHYHEGLAQMFVFGAGAVKGQIDYLSHDIVGPALVWLPALCSHAFDYQVGMEGWVITVPTIDVMRVARDTGWAQKWISKPQLLVGALHQELLDDSVAMALQVEKEHRKFDEERNFALESLFALLLVKLNRGLSVKPDYSEQSSGRQQQLVNRFQSLLEQNETNRFSVNEYAHKLSVTTTHLSRTIKIVTGKTAGEMISDRLLLAAKRKLVFSDLPISEIAYMLEFSSPSYFTRFFVAQAGETPKQFRGRMREQSSHSVDQFRK